MTKRNAMAGNGAAPERSAGARRKRTPRKSSLPPEESKQVAAEELHRLIAEKAYYKAQQRGFAPGYEHEDWIKAEAEVMQRLGISRA